VTASVDVNAAVVPLETANLLGALPGTDPTLGEEIVMVGGHIDHLGEDVGSGQLFLGADDNASGTAVTMELARAMVLGDTVPARTLLFAAWNGEEAGLIGSCFYVSEPTVSLSDIMVMFSLDMVGGGDGSGVDVYGGTQSSYGWLMDVIEGATAADGLTFDVDPVAPLDASDHACFAQAGRPAVMLSTAGTHGYYHTPADTIDNVTVEDLEAALRISWATLRTLATGEEAAFTQGFRAEPAVAPPTWRGSHRLLRTR
jgi:Zn-dependent M28 family amino/carboxypeptidase